MTNHRSQLLLALSLITWLLGGCNSPVADDDDTGGVGDDDASGDDDTTSPEDPPFSSSPADGSSLSWDGCISLDYRGDELELPDLLITATDDQGAELQPFAGRAELDAMVMPTRPWPPGGTVHLELTWDGGGQSLTYDVEDLDTANPDPAGDGWALNLTYGTYCPDYSPLTLMLPEVRHSLVDVVGSDGQGGAELRVGLSAGDEVSQDPCVPTADVVGSYEDPLLWAPAGGPLALFPPLDAAARSNWVGVQLAPNGALPVTAATGALMDGDALDELVGDDVCELLSTLAAPWCGRCPEAPDEECLYLYVHSMPTTERAGLLMERSEADVEADPACE